MEHNLAPIALFVYNRPGLTGRTIEALQKNYLASESDLFVFSDAAKNKEDTEAIDEVRWYLETISGFRSIRMIKREKNLGLAKSIIAGVTEIVNQRGRVIVLEDDLVTSPYFLKFMNEALEKYESDERIISVHGYIYPVKEKLPETFFLRGADCWGWATWKRGWNLFEADGQKLLAKIRRQNLGKAFNLHGSYHYTQMLEDQTLGKNDSWAIRWYASAFLQNKLTLYPGKSLVNNIGFGAEGTHTKGQNKFATKVSNAPVTVAPIPVEESKFALKAIKTFFKSQRPSLLRRILNKIQQNHYGFFGDYGTWEHAQKDSTGYNFEAVLSKVKTAAEKIKKGEAAFERDSVLFDRVQYSWPVLSILLWIASKNDNKLNLVDFGGSLGSSYYQNIKFLRHLKALKWSIVEQPHFVKVGKESFENEHLKFYSSLNACAHEQKPQAILFSSVLPYLEKPYEILELTFDLGIPMVIIDRTPFIEEDRDRLTVQKVPPKIYEASYPAWFFSKIKFLDFLKGRYEIMAEFNSPDKANITSQYQGFVLSRL